MLSKSQRNLFHALRSRSGRRKHGLFVAEGVRVVEDLLASGFDITTAVVATTLEDSARGQALLQQLERVTAVQRVSERVLAELAAAETPQGVVVAARIPAPRLAQLDPKPASVVLVLDAVQDPGNLGTLIRSADAFATDCVIGLPGTADYWNPKVVRAAAGAAFRVPLINSDAEAVWQWLDEHRFVICGADMHGEPIAREVEKRVALVVGNEGSGLRAETRAHIERLIAIPMPGRAESLNVAVAAGILLYELNRRG